MATQDEEVPLVQLRRRLTRRAALGAFGGLAAAAAGCSSVSRAPSAHGDDNEPVRITYGTHPSQFAELTPPSGRTTAPVVVVIHGGYWSAAYGAELGRPLAHDLSARGFAVLNVEYRRVGDGGGWPQTGHDVAAAVGVLREHDVDLNRVVALGHSAGGQLAGWLAAQRSAPVPLTGAVLQAGVLDLEQAAMDGLGGGAVVGYLGATPSENPQVYGEASPLALVPLGIPTVCVHGNDDTLVPIDQSQRFVDAARQAGDDVELQTFTGDHFAPITVGTHAWQLCVDAVTTMA